jgi:branched-chain amino acid transport system permease protein
VSKAYSSEEAVTMAYIVNGILLSSIYIIVALGLTLVYSILNVPNFAHGELVMLGAYICVYLVKTLEINYFITFIITILALAGLGILLERFVFRPLSHSPPVTMFIAALGLVYILRSIVQLFWGKEWLSLPTPFTGAIILGGAPLTHMRVFIFSVSCLAMIIVCLFIYRTWLGKGIRAVSQSESGAALVGINANLMNCLTFALGSALAGCAGILLGHVSFVNSEMGFPPLLKAFAMIIIGGMGSIPGAIIGGFFIGAIETFSIAFLSTEYTELFAFSALVVTLAIRPRGLMGRLE